MRNLDSHGLLVDLAAGYRLPKRRGVVALQVTNLLDQDLFFPGRELPHQPRAGQSTLRTIPHCSLQP